MRAVLPGIVVAALCLGQAYAAELDVVVTDGSGRPAANAVVSLAPSSNVPVATHLPQQAVIDQRNETFLPLDVVVPRGGRVIFTNNDTTKHQVYSFSPIKQFQFVIDQGETAAPVEFPRAGIAAIGCNIHDQMIAYVIVSEAPYAVITDASGHAVIADIAPGRYRVMLWHPQMGPNIPSADTEIAIGETMSHLTRSLPFIITPPRAMMHMHMDY